MAHEETPVTYSSIAGAVGYPTQYAKALESQALQEHYADRDRQQMMDELAMEREQRAEQRRDFLDRLAIQKGQREQERLDLEEKRQAVRENYYDLRQKKQDELNDKFEEIGTALSLINPLHKEASKDLQKIQQSGTFKMLLAHLQTREAVNKMFKDQADQVRAIRKDITDTADKQYGIKNFNPDDVKATESGEYDYTHFHGTQLPSMAKALDEKTRAEYESTPEKPGYTKYEERDEFGRPVAKFIKTPPIGQEERVQMASDIGLVPSGISASGQVTYSRPKEKSAGYEMIDVPGQKTKFLKKEQQFGIPTGKLTATEASSPSKLPSISDFANQWKQLQSQAPIESSEQVDSKAE